MSFSPAADPHFLPHRLFLDRDLVELVPTDRRHVAEASFLDGRSDFSNGASVTVRLSELLAQPIAAPTPDRYIFHVAFCGSTLLSRLLDVEGQALVLREPQALVDIATRWAAIDQEGLADRQLVPVLNGVRALLRRRWARDEAVLVKPTNWINNIVPDICADREAIRPLFLTMSRAAFLRAIFRGGSDRLAFAARAAVHLSSRGHANSKLLATALARDGDQIGKLAGVAIVTHEIQMRLFSEAVTIGGWSADHWLTMDELILDPHAAVRKAAQALDLGIGDEAMDANCRRWLGRHAKQPDAVFSSDREQAGDERMMIEHAGAIEDALVWAESAIGEDQGIADRSQPVTDRRGSGA